MDPTEDENARPAIPFATDRDLNAAPAVDPSSTFSYRAQRAGQNGAALPAFVSAPWRLESSVQQQSEYDGELATVLAEPAHFVMGDTSDSNGMRTASGSPYSREGAAAMTGGILPRNGAWGGGTLANGNQGEANAGSVQHHLCFSAPGAQ